MRRLANARLGRGQQMGGTKSSRGARPGAGMLGCLTMVMTGQIFAPVAFGLVAVFALVGFPDRHGATSSNGGDGCKRR